MVPFACSNPVRITLPNGNVISVPCGHCDACLCQKGLERSTLLKYAVCKYRFKYFVTLTYNNEHLPLARLTDGVLYHPNDCDYNGVVYSASLADFEKSNQFISSQLAKFGGLPVLSHRDCTNFKKRFRKYVSELCKLNSISYEEIFIYLCGEYGPTTFRPHYHCIFCTNSEKQASFFECCIRKAWSNSRKTSPRNVLGSFGQIDFQRCTTAGCERYVAQYLNFTTHLPNVLSRSQFRPFSQKPPLSRFCYDFPPESLRKIFFNASCEVAFVSPIDNATQVIPLPANVKSRLFPRIYGFGRVDSVGLNQLYNFALRLRYEEIGLYYEFLQKGFIGAYDEFIYRLLSGLITDKFACVNALKRIWYVSRRVIDNARLFGVSLPFYISQICKFYSNVELKKLRNFYALQNDLLRRYSCPLSDLMALYIDTEDNLLSFSHYSKQFGLESPVRLNSLPIQRQYLFMTSKIVLDTTKTKKRNDYFTAKGRIKKQWVYNIPHRLKQFISN